MKNLYKKKQWHFWFSALKFGAYVIRGYPVTSWVSAYMSICNMAFQHVMSSKTLFIQSLHINNSFITHQKCLLRHSILLRMKSSFKWAVVIKNSLTLKKNEKFKMNFKANWDQWIIFRHQKKRFTGSVMAYLVNLVKYI